MKISHQGFTLSEIMITLTIIAVLAGAAIPRLTVVIERQRSTEGVNILTTLRGAQERYRMENSAYTKNLLLLDVEIPQPANFNAPDITNAGDPVACNPNLDLASITRPGQYMLTICNTGVIICASADPICQKMGYP